MYRRSALLLAAVGLSALFTNVASAGDVYLTGHDVTLHSGQNGYDGVILDYLRGATPKATYNIGFVGTSGSGFEAFTGGGNVTTLGHGGVIPLVGVLAGYGSANFYDATTLAGLAPAARTALLGGLDALVIASHTSCGGCSLTDAGVVSLNSIAADIAVAFNAGMDIFGQSAAGSATYYNFLPPGAVATGAPIGGASGFVATAAGLAIGITDIAGSSMINGHPTHNRFTSQAAAFTVFEVRPQPGAANEIISIGLRDGVITTGGISTGGATPDAGSTALLLALVLPFLGFLRRKVRS